ncbi:MAG TPA: polyprenyl synthetase family protein [Thermoleophilia bacterium]|nr:polyprenyl synthetase family protein [Thermoleophilia bacterium]
MDGVTIAVLAKRAGVNVETVRYYERRRLLVRPLRPAAGYRRYGEDVGLAFQIADDLLDLTGDAATLGKRVGKDEAAGKATLPSLVGVDEARRRANTACDAALESLESLGGPAEALRALARFVVTRRR